MVKRMFWVTLGATVGILVVTKASKTLRRFTPSGIADSASGVPGAISGALHGFADDFRAAATEREFELYHVLGVDVSDPGE
jgi:hypothetical protein